MIPVLAITFLSTLIPTFAFAGGPTHASNPDPPTGKLLAILYTEKDYGGKDIYIIDESNPRSASIDGNWHDIVSSLKVAPGHTLRVCKELNFLGACQEFQGDVPWIGTRFENDVLSSYEIYMGKPDPAYSATNPFGLGRVGPDVMAVACSAPDFQGDCLHLRRGDKLDSMPGTYFDGRRWLSWNDRVASLAVRSGWQVEACISQNFEQTNSPCARFPDFVATPAVLPEYRDLSKLALPGQNKGTWMNVIKSIRVAPLDHDNSDTDSTIFQQCAAKVIKTLSQQAPITWEYTPIAGTNLFSPEPTLRNQAIYSFADGIPKRQGSFSMEFNKFMKQWVLPKDESPETARSLRLATLAATQAYARLQSVFVDAYREFFGKDAIPQEVQENLAATMGQTSQGVLMEDAEQQPVQLMAGPAGPAEAMSSPMAPLVPASSVPVTPRALAAAPTAAPVAISSASRQPIATARLPQSLAQPVMSEDTLPIAGSGPSQVLGRSSPAPQFQESSRQQQQQQLQKQREQQLAQQAALTQSMQQRRQLLQQEQPDATVQLLEQQSVSADPWDSWVTDQISNVFSSSSSFVTPSSARQVLKFRKRSAMVPTTPQQDPEVMLTATNQGQVANFQEFLQQHPQFRDALHQYNSAFEKQLSLQESSIPELNLVSEYRNAISLATEMNASPQVGLNMPIAASRSQQRFVPAWDMPDMSAEIQQWNAGNTSPVQCAKTITSSSDSYFAEGGGGSAGVNAWIFSVDAGADSSVEKAAASSSYAKTVVTWQALKLVKVTPGDWWKENWGIPNLIDPFRQENIDRIAQFDFKTMGASLAANSNSKPEILLDKQQRMFRQYFGGNGTLANMYSYFVIGYKPSITVYSFDQAAKSAAETISAGGQVCVFGIFCGGGHGGSNSTQNSAKSDEKSFTINVNDPTPFIIARGYSSYSSTR